jgi:hypothetical protein
VCCPSTKQLVTSELIEPINVYQAPSGCDRCPVPNVTLVPFGLAPSVGHAFDEASLLGFSSAAFFTGIGEADPKASCITLTENTAYNPGPDGAPEMGDMEAAAGGDYIIIGKIIRSTTGTGYGLLVGLQDATTRENVTRNITVEFTDPYKVTDIARAIAAQYAPMIDKIRDFQKKKRDESNDLAIKAMLKVTPSKQKMNVGETQSVEVFVYDCDGEDHPLKNRKLTLRSDNGTFSPAEVTTGPDGKVKSTFTAQKKGLGPLIANYPYTSVTHNQKTAAGHANIQIGDPPSGVWEATIDVEQRDTTSSVKKDADSSQNDHQSISREAHLTVWIQTEDRDGQVYGTQVLAVSGDATYDFLSSYQHATYGRCPGRSSGRIIGNGVLSQTDLVFQITVDTEKANINGTIPIAGSSDDHSWWRAACQTPASGSQHQTLEHEGYAVELRYGSDQLDAPQTAATKQSRTFKFSLDKHDHDGSGDSVSNYDRTGTITLRPLTVSQTPPGMRRH